MGNMLVTRLSVLLCCTVGGACDLIFPLTYLHCSYVQMTIKALNLETRKLIMFYLVYVELEPGDD